MLLDIRPDHLQIVQAILQKHIPEHDVWAFGSRAKWTAKDYSDLDLCVITKEPLSFKILGAMAEDFSESDLPWKVDVVDWSTTNESFQKIIEKDKVVVQKGVKGRRMGSEWQSVGRVSDSACAPEGITRQTAAESETYVTGNEYPYVFVADVCSVGDGAHSKVNRVSEGLPYLTSKNIGQGKLKLENYDCISEADFDRLFPQNSKATRRPMAGDVLIGIIGTFGNAYLYKKNDHFGFASSIGILRPNQKLLFPGFLYYAITSPKFKNVHSNYNAGSVQGYTNIPTIKKLQLPLPPLNAQKKITGLLTSLDDRIALLRETNATLEAIAQALFKSWFVDFDPVHAKQQGREPEGMDADIAELFSDSFEESELGLVPKGWRVGKVSDIGEVICGKTPPTSEPENYGDDVPFITIPDMHNLLAITSTNRSLSILGANTQKKKTLPIGSICVSCIATAGLVARVTEPSQTNQQINSVVPLAKWGNSFPLFTLRRIGDAVRAGGSGGSVFHNLNKSGFEQLKVLFPCKQLALAFNDIVEPAIEKIIANQKQAQTLTNLRDTLLPRLISGQLRLPDAEEAVA